MQFVKIQGHTVRIDAVDYVGPCHANAAEATFEIHLLGSPTGIIFRGARRSMQMARNKLLRAMGAGNV